MKNPRGFERVRMASQFVICLGDYGILQERLVMSPKDRVPITFQGIPKGDFVLYKSLVCHGKFC
jgi:hypothetical protein